MRMRQEPGLEGPPTWDLKFGFLVGLVRGRPGKVSDKGGRGQVWVVQFPRPGVTKNPKLGGSVTGRYFLPVLGASDPR